VDEYHHMIRAGFFAHSERFELLEGYIVPKIPRDPIHDATVDLVIEVLRTALPPGWRPRAQSAITTDDSEPEPDIAVIPGKPLDFASRHPGPQDSPLIIEVSDTTLADDPGIKQRVYARAGVATYWIVNIRESQIEVYTQPSSDVEDARYASRVDRKPGEQVALEVPGHDPILLAVSDLLP
jgi:Uma2 family endonuclease